MMKVAVNVLDVEAGLGVKPSRNRPRAQSVTGVAGTYEP